MFEKPFFHNLICNQLWLINIVFKNIIKFDMRNDFIRLLRHYYRLTKQMARNFASMKINYHIYTQHVRFRDTTIKSTWILSFVHPRFEPPSTFEMYFNIFHPHPSCHMPISKGSSSFYTRYCADPWRISIFRFETEKYSVNVAATNSTSIRVSLCKNLIFQYIYIVYLFL